MLRLCERLDQTRERLALAAGGTKSDPRDRTFEKKMDTQPAHFKGMNFRLDFWHVVDGKRVGRQSE